MFHYALLFYCTVFTVPIALPLTYCAIYSAHSRYSSTSTPFHYRVIDTQFFPRHLVHIVLVYWLHDHRIHDLSSTRRARPPSLHSFFSEFLSPRHVAYVDGAPPAHCCTTWLASYVGENPLVPRLRRRRSQAWEHKKLAPQDGGAPSGHRRPGRTQLVAHVDSMLSSGRVTTPLGSPGWGRSPEVARL